MREGEGSDFGAFSFLGFRRMMKNGLAISAHRFFHGAMSFCLSLAGPV